jgi:tRNA A37 methylthiotransferase MiaB
MNRSYTREWYMAKVDRIKEIMPDCGISSDVIAGFCTETEEDHKATLNMMEYAGYDMSYMFFYSERPGTLAAKRYKDDVPEEIKKRRLKEVVDLQGRLSYESNKNDVGKTFKVLIEGNSKKSDADWMGRNSQNKVIVFSKENYNYKKGDYVNALHDINLSIKMYPTNSYAYRNLALVYIALNKMKEACTSLGYAMNYGFEKRYGPQVSELFMKYCK